MAGQLLFRSSVCAVAELAFQPGQRLLLEEIPFTQPRGGTRLGQPRLAQVQFHSAGAGDGYRVAQGLRQVGEQLGHFRRCPEVLLGRVAPFPARIVQRFSPVYAHPRFVRGKLAAVQETHVVDRHQRDAFGVCQFHRSLRQLRLARAAQPAHLQKEAVPHQPAQGQYLLALPARLGSAAGGVVETDQPDQALQAPGAQPIPHERRHFPRLQFEVHACKQRQQVPVTPGVPAQERHPPGPSPIPRPADCEVRAQNGLDSRVKRSTVKAHRPEHVVEVGQSDGGHSALARRAAKASIAAAYAQHRVHQREFRVQSKMNELSGLFHGDFSLMP